MSRPDLRDLIGIPFVSKGRDPKKGLDCWGLLREVMRRYGHDVPEFEVACGDLLRITSLVELEKVSGRWTKIEKPEPGCIVAMAIDPEAKDVIQHFAVYIGFGNVIHTMRKVFSCTTFIEDDAWRPFVRGFYRWVG